jgi:hypothetical protein
MAEVKNTRHPWRALRSRFLHRITGRYTLRGLTAPRTPKTAVGLRPLCGFAPPHLGRGSLLRNALSPAPNVVYRRTLYDIPPKLVGNIMKKIYKNNGEYIEITSIKWYHNLWIYRKQHRNVWINII